MKLSPTPRTLVVAPDPAIYENCPVLTKVEAVTIQQGTAATVQYNFRDSTGTPIDLSGLFFKPDIGEIPPFDPDKISKCDTVWGILAALNPEYYGGGELSELEDSYFFEARIQPADEPRRPLWVAPVKVVNPKLGILQFEVPDKPSMLGGIYSISLGLCRSSDRRPLYIQRALLNVERSAFRPFNVDTKTPTISDVRMRIMDTDVENLLQGYVEFTTADILDSVVSAVREWNGTTPHLAQYTFTCFNFPWIEPWLNKIIASLYQKAALATVAPVTVFLRCAKIRL